MSQTPFSNKVEILGEFWMFYRDQAEKDEGWQDFLSWADIGLPMAYMAWQELVTIKPDSKIYVEQTWDVLCEMLNLDPQSRFGSIAEMFDASPNDPLDAEG